MKKNILLGADMFGMGGGGGGGEGGGDKPVSTASSSTSGNNFGGDGEGGFSPILAVSLGIAAMFGFLILLVIVKK